ncbi:MAG: hypothetical protein KTR16_07080 [Acidiferrobacterales bacterium]|nr:hypothetical protein [Acidiferrobacterales bacterium]
MNKRYWDKSDWLNDDKVWLEKRKQEWKYIQFNLKKFSRTTIRGSYLKHHKNLFFKGEIVDELFAKSGGREFHFILPLFVMMYHPNLTQGVIDEIIDWCCNAGVSKAQSLDRSREFLFDFSKVRKDLDPVYGLMGGKEELVTLALWGDHFFWGTDKPGTKFDQVIFENRREENYTPQMLHPNNISRNYWSSVISQLWKGEEHRTSIGEFLFDHAMQASESVHWSDEGYVKHAASDVVCFQESPNTLKESSEALSVREKMLNHYKNGDFPSKIQSIWDAVSDEDVEFREW